jgi:hypothetical protein
MCKVVAGILAVTLGFVAAAAGGDSGNANDTADPTSARSTKQFPNIVLIIIDTLRADKLGCYGCTQGTSPELDGLAKIGGDVQARNRPVQLDEAVDRLDVDLSVPQDAGAL